jgi:hypothetical protein
VAVFYLIWIFKFQKWTSTKPENTVLASGLVLAAGWERERDGVAADSDPAAAQGLGQRG